MTDPETPDEAYERLLRETQLGQQIEELESVLGSYSLYVVSKVELMLLIDQLRELRARRVAMGREPDDEVNAAADLRLCECCDEPATCQGRQTLACRSGSRCDKHCEHDGAAGCEPIALRSRDG